MPKRRGYEVRDRKCMRKKCFVPFSGNGRKICRLYELGRCPSEESAAEYAARDEDTPEKLEWFRKGIARRREELEKD